MRTTKKLISILLAVLMMMTSASLMATGFAAATTAQWDTLIAALKKDAVKTAAFSVSDGTATVTDTTGDILAAMNAYMAVFNATYNSNATQTTTIRTSTQVKANIKTQLQNKMGATDFNAYNVSTVLDNFNANVTVDDSTDKTSARTSPKIEIVINLDGAAVYGAYDTIDSLPATLTTQYTFSVTHTQKSYASTGCNSTTYYYLITGSFSSKQTKTVSKTAIVNAKAALDENAAFFGYSLADCVALGTEACAAASTAISDAVNAVSAYVFAKYFTDYANVAEVLETLKVAVDIAVYTAIVARERELYATDYSSYDKDQLLALYTEFGEKFDVLDKTNDLVKEYFGITEEVRDDYAAKLAEFKRAYQLAVLKYFKENTVDPAYNEYILLNEDDVIAGTTTKAQIEKAKGDIQGYLNALDSYDALNVIEVFTGPYLDDINALNDNLAYLIEVADADIAFANKYAYFISTVYAAVDLDDSSEELLAAVDSIDDWFTELKAFEAQLVEKFGEETANKIFDGLDAEMNNKLNEKYAVLEARLAAQVDIAYTLLDEAKIAYGGEVTIVSVETFGKLYKAVGALNRDLADFLKATANYTPDEELIAKYDELCAVVFDDYNEFLESGGYDQFEQITFADIIRKASEDAKVRNEDFEVDHEKLEGIIDLIAKILNSDELKALGVDLSTLITPDLIDGIFSDKIINSIVQYVYPVVAKEFAKVWADLPTNVETDSPIGSGKLDVKLSLYDLTTSMKNIQFFIFPGLLADNIAKQYPDVAAVLKQATTKPVYHPETDVMDNPWEDAAICNEDGTLALNWGIDEAAAEDKEEAFLNAAQAALSGLEPLLLALISNKTLVGTHSGSDNDIAKDGKPGHGKVGTGSTSIKILVSISVTVDPINLFLDISGNPGYNNAIVPILEALGLEADKIPDGNTFTSVKDVLKTGLIDPIRALLEKVAENPVDYILRTLPNLAYAVEAGRIVPLLSMLKTDINYHADAHYSAVAGLAAGDIDEALSDGPIAIDLGEMIDLEDLGLDISSFNAVLQLVAGLLGDDITLPAMQSGVLASLGTLTQIPTERQAKTYSWGDADKAAFIEANRADVLLFLFDYVINALKTNPDLITNIVNAVKLAQAEEAAEAEEGEEPEEIEFEPFVMPEAVTAIINNVIAGYDKAENKFDALAALAELIYAKEYDTTADTLELTFEALDPDYAVTDLRTGETVYTYDIKTDYTDWWTEEKAEYVAENLPSFIDNILLMFGVKIGDQMVEGLGDTVDKLMESLYTPETIEEIAAALSGLFAGLEIDEELKALLITVICNNIGDITVWDNYDADFESGDKEAFKAALADVLAPIAELLKFVLADEDITLSLTDTDGAFQVIEAKGYAGYKYGLIPLMEALGAEGVLSEEEFIADKDNIIANIVDPLLAAIDKIAEDPYTALETIVPNFLYFLKCNGLQVAIDNLLYPVNQLLETIEPIYKVDLTELIGFDITFAETDPIEFIFNEVAAAIEQSTGIDFDLDLTTDGLLNDLAFGKIVEYTSATGDKAYKVVYDPEYSADSLTQILRYVMEQLLFSTNTESLLKYAREQFELPDAVYYPLYAILFGMYYEKDTHVDYALGILYYVFYGANTAVEAVSDYYKYMRYDWQDLAENLADTEMTAQDKAMYLFSEIYDTTAMTIVDSLYEDGTIPINSSIINSLIELLMRFINFFKSIFTQISAMI